MKLKESITNIIETENALKTQKEKTLIDISERLKREDILPTEVHERIKDKGMNISFDSVYSVLIRKSYFNSDILLIGIELLEEKKEGIKEDRGGVRLPI